MEGLRKESLRGQILRSQPLFNESSTMEKTKEKNNQRDNI